MSIDFNNELIKNHVEFLMPEEDANQLDAAVAKALFYLICFPEEGSNESKEKVGKEKIFTHFYVISHILGLPELTWKENKKKEVVLINLRDFQFKEGKITEKNLNSIVTMLSSKETIFRAYALPETTRDFQESKADKATSLRPYDYRPSMKANRTTVYDPGASFLLVASEYGQEAILRFQKIPDEFIKAFVKNIAETHEVGNEKIDALSKCIISRKKFESEDHFINEVVKNYLKRLEKQKGKINCADYVAFLKEGNLVDENVFSPIYLSLKSFLSRLESYNPGAKTKFKESKQIVRQMLFEYISKPKENKKIEWKAQILKITSKYLQDPTAENLQLCFNKVNEISQDMKKIRFLANKEGEFRVLLKELLTAFESHYQIASTSTSIQLKK